LSLRAQHLARGGPSAGAVQVRSISQHLSYFACIYVVLRFLAPSSKVQQVVVCQIHQLVRPWAWLVVSQAGLMPFEKPLDEQVVFQQAAAAAPPQLAQRPSSSSSSDMNALRRPGAPSVP
jgi:hypothetical protein